MHKIQHVFAVAALAFATTTATVAAQDNGAGPLLSEGACEKLYWDIWKLEQMSSDLGLCGFSPTCWSQKALLRAAINRARDLYTSSGCELYRTPPPPIGAGGGLEGRVDTSILGSDMVITSAVSTP